MFFQKKKRLTFESLSIDRFQVSHFRPVVMEIEIGGRFEKSLGGQESAAVDQECMGSNASSCSFALSFPIRLPFFLSEPVSCRGQWIACSNGKRNRSFTKNIISNHLCSGGWNPYTDSNVFSSSAFFFFFLSIAIRSIGVHRTVPGYIDQNVFGLQRTAKKNGYHFMKNCNAKAHTNQPIERRARHQSCV